MLISLIPDSDKYMVLGMGAVLAATTNTPVATCVMMLEMSLSFDLVIPLAICITVSYLVSAGTSLYEGQKILPYCPRCATPLSNFETNQAFAGVTRPSTGPSSTVSPVLSGVLTRR